MQVSTGWEAREGKSEPVFALDCVECDGFPPKRRLFGTPLCPSFVVQFPSPLASTCSHFNGHELNLKVRKRV